MSFFTSGIVPSGVVLPYAGSTAPQGWLLCYGQEVSRTTYSGLFAAIGTIYGNGNGSTTFNVPDCRGRAMFGKDNMGGVAANRVTNAISGITGTTLGAVGGSESMHGHTHTVTGTTNIGHTHASSTVSGVTGYNAASSVSITTNLVTSFNSGQSATHGAQTSVNYNGSLITGTGSADAQSWTYNNNSGTAAGQTLGVTNVALSSGLAANQGAGGSQNMVPTIIMNTIIKV